MKKCFVDLLLNVTLYMLLNFTELPVEFTNPLKDVKAFVKSEPTQSAGLQGLDRQQSRSEKTQASAVAMPALPVHLPYQLGWC